MRKKTALFITALTIAAASSSVTAQAASSRNVLRTNSCIQLKKVIVSQDKSNCSLDNLKKLLDNLGIDSSCIKWDSIIWNGNCQSKPVVPELPGNSETPGVPELPGNSETPVVPELPGNSETPVVPELPGDSETPEVPETPGNSETPDVPEMPGNSETPGIPSVPGSSETPETPNTPVSPEKPDVPETLSYAQQVANLVNVERAKEGLSALTIDETLESAALVRAKEIQTSFSHTRPNGSKFDSVLREAGISFRNAGENIAWGQRTPEEVVTAWMNSPSHRANIMNSKFSRIGVGHLKNGSGASYWVQLFTN